MVDVILAGYNVDVEYLKNNQKVIDLVADNLRSLDEKLKTLNDLVEGGINGELFLQDLPPTHKLAVEGIKEEGDELLARVNKLIGRDLTPETLSAAYARISRDPAPVTELRRKSRKRVAKARASNQNIVFGMGHHSVAEHAVFNFDILGLSRLATEWLEEHRLCSYTEKSQRYITLSAEDFMDPKEITGKNLEKMLKLREQKKDLYFEAYPMLLELQKNKNPKMVEEKLKTLDGWAKEDARYCVDLTTVVQLGMTANARNLEKMVRTGRYHPSEEVRELSKKVHQAVYSIAPSLMPMTDAKDFKEAYGHPLQEEFIKQGREDIKKATEEFLSTYNYPCISGKKDVKLVRSSPILDERVISSLAFSNSNLSFLDIAYFTGGSNVEDKKNKEKIAYVKEALKNLSEHDAVPREFENIEFIYEMVVSASCYAQLKRHRMTTQIMQEYNPDLGYVIPETVKEIGFEQKYHDVMDKSSELFYQIQKTHPEAASYVLTNGHQRRVLVKSNVRELYAFSRLREDGHAQWDIRDKAHKMVDLARKAAPITMMLACGKDGFEELKKEVYEKKDDA